MRFDLISPALLTLGVYAAIAAVPSRVFADPPAAAASPSAPLVLLSFKVFDVDRTELRKIGFDFQPQGFNKFGPESPLPALLEFLTEKKLAKVIASPNIATTVGRPAYFNGGSHKAPVRTIRDGKESVAVREIFGTEVKIGAPEVLANGDLRIECKLRITSTVGPYESSITLPDGSQQIPRLKTFEVDAGFQFAPDETHVLSLMTRQDATAASEVTPPVNAAGAPPQPGHEILHLVLIKAELTDAADHVAAERVAKTPQVGDGTAEKSR